MTNKGILRLFANPSFIASWNKDKEVEDEPASKWRVLKRRF
jgi:hypothetical protein